MARTKRKINPVLPVPAPYQPTQRIYHAGGYARLSVEDSGRPGADTIENQEELIRRYIEKQPDMKFSGMYCDNGQTGTNFERPQFERLMEAVKTGKIDCIVVKDLSRFGRNYRETGNYLERIFPFLGVRFVAVSDHFDTQTAEHTRDGYIVPLKNMMNEIYSKDISRKSGTALAVKQRKGEFIGSWAAYGYKKCADDRHRIEPDKETAPVVRQIFQWRLSGMAYGQIARKLNEQQIPSPSRYHYLKGDASCERYANAVWRLEVVKQLLGNQVYLGHMIQGRKRASFCEGKKQQKLPESEWIVVKNTHEPLVDEDTFYLVQKMAEEKKAAYKERLGKYDHLGKTSNMFKGLVYCADCGKHLIRYKSVTCKGTKVTYFYICPSHLANPQSCPKKYMPETDLTEILWDALKKQMNLAENLSKQVQQYCFSAQASTAEAALDREVSLAVQAVKRAQRLYDSLYPMYAEDKALTEKEYLQMKQIYREKIEQAQRMLEAVEERKKIRLAQTQENPWLKACLDVPMGDRLTAELAHGLLSRVELYADNQVSITLRYQDEYRQLVRFLEAEKKAVMG